MKDTRRELVESVQERLQRSDRPQVVLNRDTVWALCEALTAALDERDRANRLANTLDGFR